MLFTNLHAFQQQDTAVELGIVLVHENEFENAILSFNEALEIRKYELFHAIGSNNGEEKTNVQLQIAKIHNNIGCAMFEIGLMEEALQSFESTLEIQREIMDQGNDSSLQGLLAMSATICNIGKFEYFH